MVDDRKPLIVKRSQSKKASDADSPGVTVWSEAKAVTFFTLAVLATISLLSFHFTDPGPFVAGNLGRRPENWGGYFGAYIADTIIYLLGLVGVWVPVLLARFGLLALVGEKILKPGRIIVWISVFLSQAVLFQWVVGSQALEIHGHSSSIDMGGALGIVVGVELSRWLGEGGAAVVIPIWVLLSLMFLWQISLKDFFSGLLAKAAYPATAIWEKWKVGRERQKLAEEREEARIQVRQKQAERIHIEEQRKSATPVRLPPSPMTPSLPLDPGVGIDGYIIPPANLLDPARTRPPVDEQQLMEIARQIERRLLEFEVQGEVVEIHPGPVVTIFEYHPAPGIKYSKILGYSDDLALTLKTEHIRMDRVGGRSNIGIEVPNAQREIISYREIVESAAFKNTPGRLPLALGKGVDGEPFISTLEQMPHLLVAGTTGSGKSVGINVLIHSILFRSSPDEVKFILIDPKHVELKVYEGIPHLLTPVVTDLKKAANALNWAVRKMGERYKMLAACKVRTIDQYNQYLRQSNAHTPIPQEQELAGIKLDKPLPYIVIVIDELYDLMAGMAKEVETAIARLSSMARAVGIHLIIATQRPSRDVITGVIKSNLPARIAYQVREKLESRLILDQNGAETLQGKGDMLFLPPGTGRVTRVHGAFISNTETQKVLQYISKQARPVFDEDVLKDQPADKSSDGSTASGSDDFSDPLYAEAVKLVVRSGVASASNLQRKMRIGYARAARLLDIMEKNGIVGPADGAKPREIFVEPGEVEDI